MQIDYNSRELPRERPQRFWDFIDMERLFALVDGVEYALIEAQDGPFVGRWVLESEGIGLSIYPTKFRYHLEDWGFHIVRHLANLRRVSIEEGFDLPEL